MTCTTYKDALILDSHASSMVHRRTPDKCLMVLESSPSPRAVAFGEVMHKSCGRRDDRANFPQPH